MKNGGSSLTNAMKRTVNAGSMLAKRREISRSHEMPLALSLAPGLPMTVQKHLMLAHTAPARNFEVQAPNP